VNERGEVIGVSYTNSTPNLTTGLPTVAAFLWRRGKMIDLGNFGGNFTGITQINNRGQVIGTSNLPGDEFYDPFVWEDGKLIDLYTSSVGGNPYTVNAINEAGQLVGAGAFGDHPYDAYLWKKGVANDLGFLEGDCYSEAIVIGSKGEICTRFGSRNRLRRLLAFVNELRGVDAAGKLSVIAQVPTHGSARNSVVIQDGVVYLGHSQLGELAGLVVVSPSAK
jgi:probable HAF family extracellular repeat protein